MKEDRKKIPIFSGVVAYFPLALKELAKVSYAGQEQHNPDKPLAWDRSKSGDELDALMRHLVDHSIHPVDDDLQLHLAKVAWRAMAVLQKYLEVEDETTQRIINMRKYDYEEKQTRKTPTKVARMSAEDLESYAEEVSSKRDQALAQIDNNEY